MKTLAALSGASLLLLSACGTTTKTYVANEAVVPADDEDPAASQDFDGDGVIDNNLPALQQALAIVTDLEVVLNGAIDSGTVLIVADITSKDDTFTNDDKKAEVTAFLGEVVGGGAPVFDGTDQIAVSGDTFAFADVSIINGNLTTGQSDFVFALPLDPVNPTLLPFTRAQLRGNVTGDTITGGSLSGVVNSLDFAVAAGGVGDLISGLILSASAEANGGTAVACDGDANNVSADCAAGQLCTDVNNDGTATGSCLLDGDALFQVFTLLDDANGNGLIEVEFNAATNTFNVNEAALVFNLAADGTPSGLLGGQFSLDLDNNNINDSMPLGILFDATLAVRQ
jgi:hypothetical protein